MRARLGLVAIASLATAGTLGAQERTPAAALLADGHVAPAESMLFQAATDHPRDAEARIALGRYLATRGALRVAAVLLEEARLFGADSRRVAKDLAPLYRTLGDYQALVTLAGSPLTKAQRSHAAWFVSHQPTLAMGDTAVAAYRAPSDTGSLGRVSLQIGSTRFQASIDPRRQGLVLDSSRKKLAEVLFDVDSPSPLGSVALVHLGDVAFGNVPVTFERMPDSKRAVIGLDLLMKLAPTFDAKAGRVVLRRGGRVAKERPGQRHPVFFETDGVRVLDGERFLSLTGAEMMQLLRSRTWTLDARRGELLLEP